MKNVHFAGLFFLCLVWGVPVSNGVASEKVMINVAGGTAWEINGYREIPKEIFGVRAASDNSHIKNPKDFLSLLKEAGFESFFYYVYPQNITRNWEDPDRLGHLKKEVFDHPEKVWGGEFHLADGGFSNLRLVNPDANYELCLQCPPDWMGLKPVPGDVPVPADPEEYARMSSALLRLYQTDPRGIGGKVKFLSFMNEPEPTSRWHSAEFDDDPTKLSYGYNGQEAIDYYIKTFKALSKQIRADFPGLQVGGPVAAYPGQKLNWWMWKNWGLRFIDGTGSLCDFYDYHPYADVGNDRDSILAQTTMIMNHVLLTQKRPMKTVLSEQNLFGLKDINDPGERFLKQLLWNQRLLFMALDNPDKIAAIYYFIAWDQRAGSFFDELLPSNLWRAEGEKLIPHPIFYLYRALRDLRGNRIYATSSHPDVLVRAALNGDRLSAVVFNDSEKEVDIALNLALPSRTKVASIQSSGWNYEKTTNQFIHFEDKEVSAETTAGTLNLKIALSPFTTQSFVIKLLGKPQDQKIIRTKEYYSDRIFVEQAAEAKPVFKIALPNRAKNLVLRLGWEGPKPDGVMVGEVCYDVPEQRPDITKIKVAEIPLKATSLSGIIEVRPVYENTYPKFNEKILFATILSTENGK